MSTDEQVKRVWTLGSYPDVGRNFLSMAAHLVNEAGVGADDRVLDVACGTGNVALTAARRGVQVTGLDITPAMLENARDNAALAGIGTVDWREGNATALPFDDDAFDAALSSVGHVFADPPEAAARELLRVTRPGGVVAFTSWTPASVVPAMAATMRKYLPPTPEAPAPPDRWGDPDAVRERLGDDADDPEFATGAVEQPAMSPAHFWEDARTQSGLFIVALERVADADRSALRSEMLETIERFYDDRRNAVSMEYRLTTASVR